MRVLNARECLVSSFYSVVQFIGIIAAIVQCPEMCRGLRRKEGRKEERMNEREMSIKLKNRRLERGGRVDDGAHRYRRQQEFH